ncbi:MAG: radical SAM protein, partial [Candidatus Lokiarchaeota archaeon]|nr:radical SAM protein [Candidatus Lokiarchaeota archaeon]
MAKYVLKAYKTALNRMKTIDSWFWARYTLNPYAGCEHACIYCDARSKRYYLHDDFERTIIVKEDIENVLENQIEKSRTLIPDVVAMGGVCDSYAPVELMYHNTRKILRVLEKHKFPVCLSTKSTNVKKDLEILDRIGEQTWCGAAFTITTLNTENADFLEPNAAKPMERFNMIEYISRKFPNIYIGINYMPIVPYIEDSGDQIREMIKMAKEKNTKFILFAPSMTLRDLQKDFFIKKVREKDSALADKILALFNDEKRLGDYILKKNKEILDLCEKHSIPTRMKRWIPTDYREKNYQIAEFLLNKAYYKQINGQYHWHLMKAGWSIQNLKESILKIKDRGELMNIPNISTKIA